MRKIFSSLMLALILISTLTMAFNVKPAEAVWIGTVYIRADGSIDPPDAPITVFFFPLPPYEIYMLRDNIVSSADGIVVEKNNIVIDGAGHTLQGMGAPESKGIVLSGRINVTVRNMQIKNFYYGVYLYYYSSCNSISGNIIANNEYGVYLYYYSSNNVICGNNITANNRVGVYIYYSSNYNSISGNNITANNQYGVYIDHLSNYNSISGNNIKANRIHGVWLYTSNYNSISGNNIKANNEYGVQISSSNYNSISGNIIANNEYGVYLYYYSSNNVICGNNITANNCVGVYIYYSSNYNSISGNNITANNQYGVYIDYSSNNWFYHNNFIDNGMQVYSVKSINVWDDGYPSGGNYWSDYAGVDEKSGPNQDQPGSDGIGDTPYVIDENNRDRYPLMKPWARVPLERIYGIPVDFRFDKDLCKGISHPEVRYLQIILNIDPDTRVAISGPGSSGDETTYFGSLTEDAVKRFQKKYGLPETGYVGPATREKLNEILAERFTEAYKQRFGLLNKEERKSAIWNYIKEFKSNYLPENFPNELVLAIAAQETGEYAHWNNEHVADDWGRGIMQITTNSYVGAGGVDSNSEECIKARNRESKIYSSMYYSNTLKGIEANIKDGLYALGDKYKQVKKDKIQPPEGYTKDEIIWMSTVQRYNGFRATPSEYVWSVGDKLIRLANGEYGDFDGFNKEFARILGEKFKKAYNEKITLYSPAQLQVYDVEGNVTGLVNGEIREDIPNSIYDSEMRTVLIFFPHDYYYYNIIGVEEATYELNAALFKEGESVSFTAIDIPIVSGATHQYTVNWDALSRGEEGVTVRVDSNGDGFFEKAFTSDSELTAKEFMLPTKAIFTFNAFWEGVNYQVTMFSCNSSITNFNFNQPQKQIRFQLSGETGETGYCNVSIPKTLLKGPWIVRVNGTNWSYTTTENDTHTFIYITYTFSSTYEVTIEGTWVIPEFPSITILLPFMLVTFLVAILLKEKKKNPKSTIQNFSTSHRSAKHV